MANITELDGLATAIAALIAVIGVLSPALGLIGQLEPLKFEEPKLFTLFAEIGALLALLLAWSSRNALHHLPGYWLWIVLALALVAVAFWLARRFPPGETRPRWVVFAGLGLYTVANASLIFGLAVIAANAAVFHPLPGEVRGAGGDVPVYLEGAGSVDGLSTRTNGSGEFRFLLTRQEALGVTEVRAGVDEAAGDNWRAVLWDPDADRAYQRVVLEPPAEAP